MYKLIIKLKQHTPIIHFQHNQEGATLRASEVKPKLDRFIIEKLTKKKGEDAFKAFKKNTEWKNWLVGNGEHPALDYKIKITPINIKILFLKAKDVRNGIENPLYFGNMGSDTPSKHYSQSDFIILTISSFQESLINLLSEEMVCIFFFYNNFGTRQSKGFGSFYPIEINNKEIELKPKDFLGSNISYLEIKSTQYDKIYYTIDYFWKWLKSGINYNRNPYKHSVLKLFIEKFRPYKWEKKKIKEHFLGITPDTDKKYFIRAFLGLPDNFTYKWIPEYKRMKGKVYSPIDLTIHVEPKNDNIERNPSPFLFVPIKVCEKDSKSSFTRIYILFNPDNLEILLNKKFELSVKKIDPVILTVGFNHKNKPITKKIYSDSDLSQANSVITDAKNCLFEIRDEREKTKHQNTINKAEDFVSFFQTAEAKRIKNKLTIETPSVLPPFESLLKFSESQVGSSFEVKDFRNRKILTAKLIRNEK